MDCHAFRRHHLAYLDDTLPGDLLVAAECHVLECAECARHDTMVRRALMLARNLPAIEPSPDFAERLQARLRTVATEERGLEVRVDPAVPVWAEGRDWTPGWRELASSRLRSRGGVAIAASLLARATAGALTDWQREPDAVLLPPVTATRPETPAAEPAAREPRFERLPASAYVVPVSAGVPVWPAAVMAGEAQVQLMGMGAASGGGIRTVSLTR